VAKYGFANADSPPMAGILFYFQIPLHAIVPMSSLLAMCTSGRNRALFELYNAFNFSAPFPKNSTLLSSSISLNVFSSTICRNFF
jgi:hypothetical protein